MPTQRQRHSTPLHSHCYWSEWKRKLLAALNCLVSDVVSHVFQCLQDGTIHTLRKKKKAVKD